MLRGFGRRFDSAFLASVVQLVRANRKIQCRIDACKPEDFNDDERLEHTDDALEAEVVNSISQVQSVESKAMATVLGVGIAVAVLGVTSSVIGPSGILAEEGLAIRGVAAVLFIAALAYFFGSGFLALQAYTVGMVYRPTLNDREPVLDSERRRTIQLYCIDQNNRMSLLRTNRLAASFDCLRNGFTTLVLLGILIIALGFFAQATPVDGCSLMQLASEHSQSTRIDNGTTC